MRLTPGFFGFQVVNDTDGSEVERCAWVDDATQEMACFEWPYRYVGYELAQVITQVNGVRIDLATKTIHVNTGVTLTIPSSTWGQVESPKQPQACTECCQEETCRRISYCAAYKCCFGEVDKP